LRTLFSIVMQSDGRLDMGVRAWAAQDAKTAATLKSIDRKRVAYLEDLFQQLGFSAPEAAARAHLIYQALIGQYAMGKAPTAKGAAAKHFEHVFDMLIRKAR
nr:hypothetical protein [Alphaproteobacteria bacterium]